MQPSQKYIAFFSAARQKLAEKFATNGQKREFDKLKSGAVNLIIGSILNENNPDEITKLLANNNIKIDPQLIYEVKQELYRDRLNPIISTSRKINIDDRDGWEKTLEKIERLNQAYDTFAKNLPQSETSSTPNGPVRNPNELVSNTLAKILPKSSPTPDLMSRVYIASDPSSGTNENLASPPPPAPPAPDFNKLKLAKKTDTFPSDLMTSLKESIGGIDGGNKKKLQSIPQGVVGLSSASGFGFEATGITKPSELKDEQKKSIWTKDFIEKQKHSKPKQIYQVNADAAGVAAFKAQRARENPKLEQVKSPDVSSTSAHSIAPVSAPAIPADIKTNFEKIFAEAIKEIPKDFVAKLSAQEIKKIIKQRIDNGSLVENLDGIKKAINDLKTAYEDFIHALAALEDVDIAKASAIPSSPLPTPSSNPLLQAIQAGIKLKHAATSAKLVADDLLPTSTPSSLHKNPSLIGQEAFSLQEISAGRSSLKKNASFFGDKSLSATSQQIPTTPILRKTENLQNLKIRESNLATLSRFGRVKNTTEKPQPAQPMNSSASPETISHTPLKSTITRSDSGAPLVQPKPIAYFQSPISQTSSTLPETPKKTTSSPSVTSSESDSSPSNSPFLKPAQSVTSAPPALALGLLGQIHSGIALKKSSANKQPQQDGSLQSSLNRTFLSLNNRNNKLDNNTTTKIQAAVGNFGSGESFDDYPETTTQQETSSSTQTSPIDTPRITTPILQEPSHARISSTEKAEVPIKHFITSITAIQRQLAIMDDDDENYINLKEKLDTIRREIMTELNKAGQNSIEYENLNSELTELNRVEEALMREAPEELAQQWDLETKSISSRSSSEYHISGISTPEQSSSPEEMNEHDDTTYNKISN